MGGIERLIYTTHSWLASIYLDCENSGIPQLPEINVRLACPSKTEIDAFINVFFLKKEKIYFNYSSFSKGKFARRHYMARFSIVN